MSGMTPSTVPISTLDLVLKDRLWVCVPGELSLLHVFMGIRVELVPDSHCECSCPAAERHIDQSSAEPISATQLRVPGGVEGSARCRAIEATDGQLLTGATIVELRCVGGAVEPAVEDDVLMIAVVNRYRRAEPAVAFIRGFGLRRGALASSVAHDSHNVIGVGVDPESLPSALNSVIANMGGLAVVDQDGVDVLPLPIAGLMSDADPDLVAERAEALTAAVRDRLGSPMAAPFVTLSFMALLVIPSLKLSDLGLFAADRFEFTEVVCGPPERSI